MDLIDVKRVERILVQALEQEAGPEAPQPLPAGRFARPGTVFAQAKSDCLYSNHHKESVS